MLSSNTIVKYFGNIINIVRPILSIYNNLGYNINKKHFDNCLFSKTDIINYSNTRIKGIKKHFCYAPLRNLYFNNSGDVLICCFNKSLVLGNLQDEKLSDIIENQRNKEIANKLKKYDLSLGCEYCEELVISRNFQALGTHQFDNLSKQDTYPTMMEFDISNTCNLECIMCSYKHSSVIAKKENIINNCVYNYNKSFVDQLEPYIVNLQKAKFYGGEPFLIAQYYDIWDLIIRKNPKCEIVVQTNATVLNNRIKNLLELGNFKISISIDSLNKDNYELIRKGANFDKVINNVNFLIHYSKTKKKRLNISICPMQQNWKNIPDLVNFCNKNEILLNFNTVNFPVSCSIRNMDSKSIYEIIKYYKEYKFKTSNFVQKQNLKHFIGLINQLEKWHEGKRKKESSQGILYPRNKIRDIFINKIKDIGNTENDENNQIIKKIINVFELLPEQIEIDEHFLNKLKSTSSRNLRKNIVILSEIQLKEKLQDFIDGNV